MTELIEEFRERLDEVDAYIGFLSMMHVCAQNGPPRFNNSNEAITVQQQRILYSGVFLLLYNLVESTMSKCIEAVSVAASGSSWTVGDLIDNLKREWVRSIARTHIANLTSENRLTEALAMCNHLVASLPINQFEIEKGGGGNWDDNEIELITKRLGFKVNVSKPVYKGIKSKIRDDLGALGLVKKFRNDLAHGSISFSQCAGDMTVQNLIDLKDKTVNYLEGVVNCFSAYIEAHEYLIAERRPA